MFGIAVTADLPDPPDVSKSDSASDSTESVEEVIISYSSGPPICPGAGVDDAEDAAMSAIWARFLTVLKV